MAAQAVKNNVLQQFVNRAHSLYSLPAVAVEVVELTGKPNVDTVALRECVERDPALTAKLLRVVNSSMFGLSREVSDLTQALALLGVKPLKLLVLGFSLPKELYSGVEAQTLQRFWRFTLVKAVAARELCREFWSDAGDEAFIAGLLQEIGVLVLVNELGDSYISFLNSVHEQGEDLVALETATLGFDHAILSARLLDHWRLPTVIVQAVAAAHEVDQLKTLSAEEGVLAQTLHLATLIASIIVCERSPLLPELLDAAAQYRGIRSDQIDQLFDQLQDQVRLMANLFSVPVDEKESYREIMSRAHTQMSETALDAIPQMVSGSGGHAVRDEQQALHHALDQYAQTYLALPQSDTSDSAQGPEIVTKPADTSSLQAGTRPSDSVADPGLAGRIMAAITSCRSHQHELSLVLLELDDYDNHLLLLGPEVAVRLISSLCRAVQSLSDIPCESMVISDTRIAMVLPDCDRQQAVRLARTLNDVVPVWMLEQGDAGTSISFSVGISSLAMPTRSSQPDDLIAAADRCLFAAQRTGGSVIKSIDVL